MSDVLSKIDSEVGFDPLAGFGRIADDRSVVAPVTHEVDVPGTSRERTRVAVSIRRGVASGHYDTSIVEYGLPDPKREADSYVVGTAELEPQ